MSPTARTLKALRERGECARVVERWVPRAALAGGVGVRQDLFGMWDIVSLRDTGAATVQLVGIQCCAMSGRMAHVGKVKDSPQFLAWKAAGCGGEVWAWRRLKVKRGGKAFRWTAEVVDVYDVADVVVLESSS